MASALLIVSRPFMGTQACYPMKKIEAIIKPFKLEEVKDALAKLASKA